VDITIKQKGGINMFLNRKNYTADCNRCNTKNCNGMTREANCQKHSIPKEGFMLAELTLAHATSLNKALSALPFETNLEFYLK
jgi:hypothetical protein